MKRAWMMAASLLALGAAGSAAQTGSIEFTVRVAPTAGSAEPARQIPFHLLRKSFADIQKEAEAGEPKPDLDKFIEGLELSKELKAWMKRTRVVQLKSAELVRQLVPEDIFTVQEFFDAYIARNAGDTLAGFPEPKYKDGDAKSNPQRYQRQLSEFRDQVRKFLRANPQSLSGIEFELADIDPGRNWLRQESERRERARLRALDLAATRYLVTKTQTDLQGRAAFTGIAPGEYWLSTLEQEAVAGNARLRWDAPVTVRAGAATRIELWNANAISTRPPR